MKTYSAIFATVFACLPVMAGEYRSVAEFTPEEPEKLDWSIVDDGVMGGLSQGKVPFNRFVGSWRGTELPDKVFDPAKIRRIGLQLAAKEAGTLRAASGLDPHLPGIVAHAERDLRCGLERKARIVICGSALSR